jgi:tRNA threonylcarbamoyl adenosine modification protein YjeE
MTKKKSLVWLNCSEEQLTAHIRSLFPLKNTIVFLEGEMGAGKSTFARVLLSQLVAGFSSQGSPTFPLVQEYRAHDGSAIYHIDLYRLKNEGELEDSGILHQIEEQGACALVEWPDMFANTFSYWRSGAADSAPSAHKRAKNVVEVSISPSDQGADLRNYKIQF